MLLDDLQLSRTGHSDDETDNDDDFNLLLQEQRIEEEQLLLLTRASRMCLSCYLKVFAFFNLLTILMLCLPVSLTKFLISKHN